MWLEARRRSSNPKNTAFRQTCTPDYYDAKLFLLPAKLLLGRKQMDEERRWIKMENFRETSERLGMESGFCGQRETHNQSGGGMSGLIGTVVIIERNLLS